jgi:hypothetical protein
MGGTLSKTPTYEASSSHTHEVASSSLVFGGAGTAATASRPSTTTTATTATTTATTATTATTTATTAAPQHGPNELLYTEDTTSRTDV